MIQLTCLNSPSRQTAARPCYARHLQGLLLCWAALLLLLQPCMALDDWCSSSTPSSGKFSLLLKTTCTLTSQVQVSSGNELSIAGAPTELTSELAVITQVQDADKDLHRLFWVEFGALRLAFVRLTGGRVSSAFSSSLTGWRACSGGLVYVGHAKTALLNATKSVVFEGGKAERGGGLTAWGSKSTIWMGAGSVVKGNYANYGGGGALVLYSSTLTTVNSVIHSNTAGSVGGGVFVHGSTLTTVNSVIHSNTAGSVGGGVYLRLSKTLSMTDSIVRV